MIQCFVVVVAVVVVVDVSVVVIVVVVYVSVVDVVFCCCCRCLFLSLNLEKTVCLIWFCHLKLSAIWQFDNSNFPNCQLSAVNWLLTSHTLVFICFNSSETAVVSLVTLLSAQSLVFLVSIERAPDNTEPIHEAICNSRPRLRYNGRQSMLARCSHCFCSPGNVWWLVTTDTQTDLFWNVDYGI